MHLNGTNYKTDTGRCLICAAMLSVVVCCHAASLFNRAFPGFTLSAV